VVIGYYTHTHIYQEAEKNFIEFALILALEQRIIIHHQYWILLCSLDRIRANHNVEDLMSNIPHIVFA
jgi:hypothetical protein